MFQIVMCEVVCALGQELFHLTCQNLDFSPDTFRNEIIGDFKLREKHIVCFFAIHRQMEDLCQQMWFGF